MTALLIVAVFALLGYVIWGRVNRKRWISIIQIEISSTKKERKSNLQKESSGSIKALNSFNILDFERFSKCSNLKLGNNMLCNSSSLLLNRPIRIWWCNNKISQFIKANNKISKFRISPSRKLIITRNMSSLKCRRKRKRQDTWINSKDFSTRRNDKGKL